MGSKGKPKGTPPFKRGGVVAEVESPPDYNKETPKFCLRNLHPEFDVESLPGGHRAAFALSLQKRSRLTWREITTAPKHGLGSELIDAGAIRSAAPELFADREEFLVLRYHGKRPMVGVRVREVFHVIWIEREFDELYDHGSS